MVKLKIGPYWKQDQAYSTIFGLNIIVAQWFYNYYLYNEGGCSEKNFKLQKGHVLVHIHVSQNRIITQQDTFSYAARRNSIGAAPKLMAWPRNGMVEGMFGGSFWKKNSLLWQACHPIYWYSKTWELKIPMGLLKSFLVALFLKS